MDARHVPSQGRDHHLPAVAPAALIPSALRQRFLTPPVWSPEVRKEPSYLKRPMALASVLVPILTRSEPTVLLTERTAHLSTHSGQVAFPGGRQDEQDTDAVAAALREAQEEVGLEPAAVQVLGQLPIYQTGSAYQVTPVVALVDPMATLRPNPHEVARVFEVPLAFLMNPANHHRHQVLSDGVQRDWFSMPYENEGQEFFIWGATAGMLRNLYRFLIA